MFAVALVRVETIARPSGQSSGFQRFQSSPQHTQNNMRALGAQLVKGHGLARLVGKSSPGLGVGKQMIQTVAQHDRRDIKTISL